MSTNDASDASRDDNRVGKLHTAGNTDPVDASSNASNASNASADASRKSAEAADSGNTGNTGNSRGDSSEEYATLSSKLPPGVSATIEQLQRIRELVRQGFSERGARIQVLAKAHPLGCDCEVCS